MTMNFNDAEGQGGFSGDLIPADTIVDVVAKLKPGGEGDDGWLRGSTSGAQMLDFEFTIDGGPFDRRKFWSLFVVDGVTEGHTKATAISRSKLRAMLESARNIKPSDESADAVKGRQVSGWGDFDGLAFRCKVGIEKNKDPQYADKNVIKAVVTPDSKDYAAPAGGASAPRASAKAAASTEAKAAAKPSWAN